MASNPVRKRPGQTLEDMIGDPLHELLLRRLGKEEESSLYTSEKKKVPVIISHHGKELGQPEERGGLVVQPQTATVGNAINHTGHKKRKAVIDGANRSSRALR